MGFQCRLMVDGVVGDKYASTHHARHHRVVAAVVDLFLRIQKKYLFTGSVQPVISV